MKFALSLITLFITTNAFGLEAAGYLKTYPIYQNPAFDLEEQKIWQNMGKIQLTEDFNLASQTVRFETSYELITTTRKSPLLTTTRQVNTSYRFDDFNTYLHESDDPDSYKTSVMQNLNRFNFSTTLPFGDLIIGRQLISFGSAKSLNPTDVLTPFAISTIDKEERQGIDAVVLRAPVSGLSTVEMGYVAGADFKAQNSAYYLRPKVNINQFDISATFMNFNQRSLIGFDLQHPIKDAGFWFEAAYVEAKDEAFKDYVRITTGSDYKFQNSFYLSFEYHYNGASLDNLFIYPENFIYVRDYHYVIPTFSYEFTPLLIGSVQTYINLHDGSFFTTPKLEYNWSDNVYLAIGTYAGIGAEADTEFGQFGQTYYTSLRYYY